MRFKLQSVQVSKSVVVLVAVLFSSVCPLMAQQAEPSKEHNFAAGNDLSLGLMGQMTFARTPTTSQTLSNGTGYSQLTQSIAPSAGELVTFHHAFKPYFGFNVNFGYTRFTQLNSFAQGLTSTSGSASGTAATYDRVFTDKHMFEMTAAYALYGPRSRHFRTTAQFGAGELVFDPTSPPLAVGELKCAATLLFGVGGEYDFSRHLSLRAEYRGLLYRTSDKTSSERLYTVTNLPAISLVYRFGSRSH